MRRTGHSRSPARDRTWSFSSGTASSETIGSVSPPPSLQPHTLPTYTDIPSSTDTELHLRQREYCTYRSIRALCVSWNVDAAKPQDLAGHVNNFDFLHQCLTSVESPDIISFGFQEMIDLESKKLTASSFTPRARPFSHREGAY